LAKLHGDALQARLTTFRSISEAQRYWWMPAQDGQGSPQVCPLAFCAAQQCSPASATNGSALSVLCSQGIGLFCFFNYTFLVFSCEPVIYICLSTLAAFMPMRIRHCYPEYMKPCIIYLFYDTYCSFLFVCLYIYLTCRPMITSLRPTNSLNF
jgi:hypothetical protein